MDSYIITAFMYIISVRDDINIKDIYEAAKNISLERSEQIMTVAEQLINEGIEKGMEKGILEGKKKTARNLFNLGFTVEQVVKATELPVEEVLKLEKNKLN